MKKIYIPLLSLTLFVGLSACNKFLDELPDNRTEIDTPEEIQELLSTAYPEALYMEIAETMSDNAGEKIQLGESTTFNTEMYFWKDNHETSLYDRPAFYWNHSYAAIASANQALESIAQLGGGTQLNYLKGEALVARAYAHFMLAYLWCKPYNPATATSDLGLPYVLTPEKVVFRNYKRLSLKDFYDAIEKDLEEGIPLIDNNKYSKPKFHFTKEAAHAFASRFYLMKGEWQKVVTHANAALGSNPINKLRDIRGQRSLPYEQKTIRYTSTEEPANALVVSAFSSYNYYFVANKYGLTLEKSEEMSGSHLHPLSVVQASWAYTFYGNDDYRNIPKYQQYFKYENISIGIGERYNMAVLLSYDEVYLNRMEAYIMLGEKDKFLNDLLPFLRPKTLQEIATSIVIDEETMDALYENKGADFNPAYTLSTQQRAWLQCVIDMRRVVFVFEGLRWFDNKRLGMKVVHSTLTNDYELLKTDPRRELQIPADAIANGLTPNPR
nr:RagB/SusD family nutrient uptake outer membrane protein [uncultured Capnocytophaga sp.]